MKKEDKQTLTPRLRFPEFREAEGWEDTSLGQVVEFRSGGTPSKSTPTFWNGSIPWVSAKDMKQLFLDDTEDHITTAAVDDGAKDVPAGTVLMLTRGMTLLKDVPICVLRRPMTFNQDVKALRPKETLDGRFLPWLLLASKERLLSMVDVAGHGTGKLNTDELKALGVAIPPFAEQQKIADCLTSLDAVVAAQVRNVEALKAHKKGLMQQLFPREGETIPRLRFPEFRDELEWEETKLESIGRVIRGSSPRPKNDSRYYGGTVPRLMVQDVTRDGKWVTPRIDSLTEEGAKLSRPCSAGTLTIVCSGNVGVVSFLAVDACIHDGFLALVEIDETVATKDFLFHSLSTLREQFEKGATHGGVFTNLTTSVINEFKIHCPSTAEQQRIADCLSTLDARIAAEADKFAALKTHKQGLTQQLFPSPEKV
jgi:restriction endonuclease S subunit